MKNTKHVLLKSMYRGFTFATFQFNFTVDFLLVLVDVFSLWDFTVWFGSSLSAYKLYTQTARTACF